MASNSNDYSDNAHVKTARIGKESVNETLMITGTANVNQQLHYRIHTIKRQKQKHLMRLKLTNNTTKPPAEFENSRPPR